jgi:hypothetical protein
LATGLAGAIDRGAGGRPAVRWRPYLLEWPLLVVVLAATALRVLAMVSYRPSLLTPDGTSYLQYAQNLAPTVVRPQGYSIFLRLVGGSHDLVVVPLVQHLALIAVLVPLYVLLRSRGAAPWLSGLALVPLALDARQISIEHTILTEAVFLALVLGAVLLLLLPARRTWLTHGSAGLLLGLAAVVRTTGLPLLALVVLFLLLSRVRWTLYVALLVAAAVPVVSYAVWYHESFGAYALSQYDGHFLYGRVAPFADCRGVDGLTADERTLCETSDASTRGDATYYVWDPNSPAANFPGVEGDAVLGSFARKVILAHPMAWAQATATDTLAHFVPGVSSANGYFCDILYRFPPDVETAECFVYVANQRMDGNPAAPRYWAPGGSFLQHYQEVMTTPRIVHGLLTLLVLGCSVVALVRRRWRGQLEALLFAGIGVGLVVLASATTLFDLRYGFQLAATMPVAAVLAVTALRGPRERPADAAAPVHDTEPVARQG